jgi:hypothetical protein
VADVGGVHAYPSPAVLQSAQLPVLTSYTLIVFKIPQNTKYIAMKLDSKYSQYLAFTLAKVHDINGKRSEN